MTAATPAPQLLALMQPSWSADVVPFADLFRRPDWMAQGACSGEPPEHFFAGPSSKRAARAVDACRRCAVRRTCLAFALEHDEVGIWGGTTDRERDRLLAGRSWADLDVAGQEQLLDAGGGSPETPTGRAGVSGRATRPAQSAVTVWDRTQPTTPCEREGCSEPATGRFCSQRCRSADGARRRRERRLAKAADRTGLSSEMAAAEARLDAVFGRGNRSTPATD